jgi:hypothetical protein
MPIQKWKLASPLSELGFVERRGHEPVEHAGGHEAVPAEGAAVDVTDGPVGVVAERVDRS